MMTVMIALGALVIDVGIAFMAHAKVQAATDMAALTAGWLLPTGNLYSVESSVNSAYVGKNYGGALTQSSPTIGLYAPTPSLAPSRRYTQAAVWSCSFQSNADQIQANVETPVTLGQAISHLTAFDSTVTSTATRNVDAAFTVGSGLAAVSQTSTMNAVLGGLLGANVSLTAVDYSNLLNANVSALSFISALATQLHVTAGTYNSLLNSTASVSNIIAAETAVLATQGSVGTAAINSLNTLKGQIALAGSPKFQVSQLLALGAWGSEPIGAATPPSAVYGQLNVYNLLGASAQAANGANVLSISKAGVSIPGVATMTVALTAIEPPQPAYYDFSTPCMSVHTAQVRTQLSITLLSGLTVPGILTVPTPVNIPVYAEIASGNGTLVGVGCPVNAGGVTSATIQANSGVANTYVGMVQANAMSNFTQEPAVSAATLVNAGLALTISGSSYFAIANSTNLATFQFAAPSQQTASQSQSFSALGAKSNAVGVSLMSGLTKSNGANLTVNVLGVKQATGSITKNLVMTSLTPLLTSLGLVLDPVLQAVFGALGLSLGNVTITASGARCGPPVLVQ